MYINETVFILNMYINESFFHNYTCIVTGHCWVIVHNGIAIVAINDNNNVFVHVLHINVGCNQT